MKSGKMLSNREIASFCEQTALILNAGITPSEGMGIMLSDTRTTEGRELINSIWEVTKQGETFYHAIESVDVFPDYVLHMVSIGEESGRLDQVMNSLAKYYEREQSINESIKNAISYPFIMIGMMVIVILVLLTKVLPIFNQVFIQLGSEMNAVSQSFLAVGVALSRYSFILVFLLILLILLFFFFTKTSKGKNIFHNFMLIFPLTRSFNEKIASGRFASGMALMIGSGMDTFTSLDFVSRLVDNKNMQQKIATCKKMIESGSNFAEALAGSEIFSHLYSRMISVAFRTGNLDSVMDKIASHYEKETDDKIYSIIAILEPTLVIILSLIVGLILLSVILPLMGIMSSIG